MTAPFSQLSCVFDGSSEYVTMGDVLNFDNANSEPFSLSVWFKTTSDGYILSKMDSGIKGYGIYIDTSGDVNFYISNQSPAQIQVRSSTFAVDDGGWHHVCTTYDGASQDASGVTIYIDGSSVSTTTVDDTLGTATTATTAELNISGRSNGSVLFNGKAGGVSIYNKELSGSENTDIYNSGIPGDLSLLSSAANLVGWWRMGDRDSFPTLKDSSSGGNDGTMVNMEAEDITPDTPTGKSSLVFDGSNAYVNVGDVLGFVKTNSWSVSAWLKWTVTANDYYLAKMLSGSPYTGWGCSSTSGSPRFELYGNDSTRLRVRTTAAYNDDQWHHVLWTYDGSELVSGTKCYVDGVDQALTSIQDNLTGTITNAVALNLGSYGNGAQPWTGSARDFAVFDKALSSGEALALYNRGNVVDISKTSVSNLVGYWQGGENDTYPTLTDRSTNSNDGTMTNMTATDFVKDVPFSRILSGTPLLPLISRHSVDFGGTDEYVTMGDVLDFERTDAFSVSVWVQTTNGSIGHLIGKTENSTAAPGWALLLDGSGKPYFDLTNSVTGSNYLRVGTTYASVNDGFWHHLAVTFNGSSSASGVKFHIDGIEVTSLTTYQDSLSSSTVHSDPLTIGRRAAHPSVTYPYVGSMDEVAVYDVELTSAQVGRIYNGHRPPDLSKLNTYSSLVGWWRMGDGDTFPTLTDNSTNSNNGTMTNMESSDIVHNDVPLDGAAIVFSQSGTDKDVSQVATLTADTLVTLKDGKGYGAHSWQWALTSFPGPLGGAPTITDDQAQEASFTPTQDGTYVVQLTRTFVGSESTDTQAIIVLDGDSHALPSAGVDGLINSSNEAGLAGWFGREDAGTNVLFDAYLRWLKDSLKAAQSFSIVAGKQVGSSTSFEGVGAIRLNASDFPPSLTATFEVVLEATSSYTAEVQLYNLTDTTVVSGSALSTTNTTPTALSGTLTMPSGQKDFEVQIRVTSGGGSVTCTRAGIVLT